MQVMEMLNPESPEMPCLLRVSAAPSADPAFTPFITASSEEIRYAQHLRQRIEERYLHRKTAFAPLWTIGAD